MRRPDIASIEARREAACGPWEVHHGINTPTAAAREKFGADWEPPMDANVCTAWVHPQAKDKILVARLSVTGFWEPGTRATMREEDAEFIAHSWDDVRDLCAYIRHLEAALAALMDGDGGQG